MRKFNHILAIFFICFIACDSDKTEELTYYESGEIKTKISFNEQGKINQLVVYHLNGERKAVMNPTDNDISGVMTYYDSLGREIAKDTYQNDTLDGVSRRFFYDSLLSETYYYYNKGNVEYIGNYDKEGNPRGGFLCADIEITPSDTLKMELRYSRYDSVRIGVLLGPLDENYFVKDTVAMFADDGLDIEFNINQFLNDPDSVMGYVVELKMPENKDMLAYYFKVPNKPGHYNCAYSLSHNPSVTRIDALMESMK